MKNLILVATARVAQRTTGGVRTSTSASPSAVTLPPVAADLRPGPPRMGGAPTKRPTGTIYYPAAGVYLNVATGTYFYLSGWTWQVSARLPASVVIDTGDYVNLELDTDKPYLFYDEHRVKFKGKKGHPKGKGKWKNGGPPF